ncbi:MAG: DUF4157 domain-containing protein [Sulfitobacter sp.]
MHGRPVSLSSTGAADTGAIHRQCAACANSTESCADCAAKGDPIQREEGAGPFSPNSDGIHQAASAARTGGVPMDGSLRAYFEPRFGADLSGIRMHRDEPAARDINARAYAIGRNIAFAPGAFAPEKQDGLRLIAHEVAHTLQGGDVIHRQAEDAEEEEAALEPNPYLDAVETNEEEETPPATTSPPRTRTDTFEDRSGGGSTSFEEAVTRAPTVSGDLISGDVRRREIAPANDTEPEMEVSNEERPVVFDGVNCEIRLEHSFGFTLVADDPAGQGCEGSPVDQSAIDLDQVADTYLNAVRGAMNDEFVIRMGECEHSCAGRDIPIKVVLTRNDTSPDTAIAIVARSGRANAGAMCMGNFDEQLPIHEGGHQVLGRGDEYPEKDADLLDSMPEWGRTERVRNDSNVMGSRRRFGRFAVFHERDFRHALTFMRAALPDCTADLVSVGDVILDYRLMFRGGFGVLGGSASGFAGAGFDVGIPLTRSREWSLLVGAHGDFLAQLGADNRRLVLAGMRVGLERRFDGASISGRVFGGVGGGLSHELGSSRPGEFGEPPVEIAPRTGGFGQAELGAGLMLPTGNGGAFTADLRLSGGGELSLDPRALQWFNAGLMLGAQF